MPNVAAVLKSEIERVARKQTRASTDALTKADRARRAEVSELRKRVFELERQVSRLARVAARQSPVPSKGETSGTASDLRWRHEGFASHRARLGLSQAQMARLIGCSALSVYKWETGQVRPRRAQLEVIAEVRKLTRSQALERLEQAAV